MSNELKWYALRTFSGHEERVRKALLAEINRLHLNDRLTEVLVPQESVYEIRNGKKYKRTRNFLPGYIIIKAALDNRIKDVIANTPSMLGFLGSKPEPDPLRDEEVDRILGRVEERKNITVVETHFAEGDPVRVIDGPFTGFSGTVKEVNYEKQKIKVEVGILGRKTPVELDFSQIEIEA
ncbi:MAG: transcription termination/antitermination protein NusG [Bacteroidota bacterium]|nr:transcription termination/antitermination protein NusG [Candidatus Kapabacteria bacterium]MDW8220897.1 transcription termination/antitermination protein NusG [Bacteroidota bacterium]